MDVISLLIGIIIGLVTGLVSGYFVTRMARFGDLRNEARRIIWNIDFQYHDGIPPKITANQPVGEMLFVSGELYFLKHKQAGDTVSALLQEITETIMNPPSAATEMNDLYSKWQKTCREMKPNWLSIFSLNPSNI